VFFCHPYGFKIGSRTPKHDGWLKILERKFLGEYLKEKEIGPNWQEAGGKWKIQSFKSCALLEISIFLRLIKLFLYYYYFFIKHAPRLHVSTELVIIETMTLIHKAHEGKRMNTLENYYIQYFHYHNRIIQEQTITSPNPLFQLTYTQRSGDLDSTQPLDISTTT
jgi:hypothetical protein